MAQYTTELGTLIKANYDLGLKDYPIFDETYRDKLNAKILEHYYFREIGFETAGLFKRYLNRTMNEIMPYYNQLYLSTLITFDPLATKNITETLSRLQSAISQMDTASTGSNSGKKVYSETPQGLLSMTDIENEVFATTADIDNNSGTASSNAQGSNSANESLNRTQTGFDGIASDLLIKYRQTFLNIDIMVIEKLNDLFMGIW